MSALRVSIGADPELFIKDKRTGLFVSAHDKLPGTKLEPHKVKLGAVQVDGVAAEFNIDPTYSSSEFVDYIGQVTLELQNFIGSDFELVSEPVADFSPEYFKNLPVEVRELGCNPDFSAWTGQVNVKPDGDAVTFRTAAGHIHIGWTKDVDPTDSTHYEDCRVIAKQLDYYLGMYSLQWDSDTKRRSLYGKAGAFRPKPYGMEYRPLSNVWLRSTKLQHWVWNAAHRAVMDVISGNVVENEFGDAAERIINNSVLWFKPEFTSSDEKKAKELYRLSAYTGLENPPPLPKPAVKTTPGKRVRPKASHKYEEYTKADVTVDIETGPPGAITTNNNGHITLIQFAQTVNPGLQMPQWGLNGNIVMNPQLQQWINTTPIQTVNVIPDTVTPFDTNFDPV